ncbi:PREDICTED: protein FAM161A [Dinoponera quadriceps]|uniref:Protein FAM161A n=1 Tax=Dinoponera quadriceps TaxID=609295 RepID=A0A6P3XH06_DINQU|nr:PREDICTED: protein FAM161A [Dinoponera quadriceps]
MKVPVDPCSRQPTPLYERPRVSSSQRMEKGKRINFAKNEQAATEEISESSSQSDTLENFLEFLESIPDYGQVHHLSNEQFKQKVEYLRRKQRLLLRNLKDSYEDVVIVENPPSRLSISRNDSSRSKDKPDIGDLQLNGKKCYLEESRTNSPILFPSGTFAGLAEDQDLLTYKCRDKDKETKALRNKEIHSASKSWSTWSESKSNDSLNSDGEDSIETKSLPPNSSKEWHPTVPKPFSFTLREEAEKYMTEVETATRANQDTRKRSPSKKRRVRPIPITSKIPLYDKLIAEKEERSRIVREESALNLLSQVRPFKLECDRRAWRSLARSSPELGGKCSRASSRFKAKPVPKNLFGTEIYDRMLEDEYYRQLRKRVRAAELLKSSSLPPSMARRERVKSACAHLQDTSKKDDDDDDEFAADNSEYSRLIDTPAISDRARSAMTMLSSHGNNLAAVLRCQASREKLEREIRERMEEKRREQMLKIKETLIGRKPAWRALRSATRHEHERDLDIRTSLRRDEAREQAERHRLQMEMMLDRVTQIPTLFERHSQSFQSLAELQPKASPKNIHRRKKKKKPKRATSSSLDSYLSFVSNSRPNSGSLTSSSGTLMSSSQSSKSSSASRSSDKSAAKSETSKKKADRGPLKVSINETAELIEDLSDEKSFSDERSRNDEREDVSQSDDNDIAGE